MCRGHVGIEGMVGGRKDGEFKHGCEAKDGCKAKNGCKVYVNVS